jgi:hypothetical protein
MGVVVGVLVTAAVIEVVVGVLVTAVAVGVRCGGGVVGAAVGPHPERLSRMMRQAIIVIFLTMISLISRSPGQTG